jgi:glutamine---fructose-6-phosphate transaminase (isomerizing)
MCGIFGMALLDDVNVKSSVLRLVLRNLAHNAQVRGRDATGYAFTSDKEVAIFKHNVCAKDFTNLKNYKKTVKKYLTAEEMPYSVIGHTRAQTQGSHENPANNHPIRTGNIVGVHNGMINNDYEKFNWLKRVTEGQIKRIAEVDSEIIFSLINYYAKTFKFSSSIENENLMDKISNPTSKAISKTTGELEGSYACAVVDAENPKILWLFRGSGQLTVHNYEEEGLIIFGSTETIINNAVSQFKFSKPTEIDVGINTGLCINIEKSTYNLFDIESGAYFNHYGV